MHIPEPKQSFLNIEQILHDLDLFIEQPGPLEIPPCSGCGKHIVVECSPKCTRAPQALSSDPERYPIERNVVPLVYELNSMRVVQTCWSCEGHMDSNNNLNKLPTISFYAASPVYSQLLIKYMGRLGNEKLLGYPWHIVLSDYAQTVGTTYSIQPDLFLVDSPSLGTLQNDLKVIAKDLLVNLKASARELRYELESSDQKQVTG